jgi:hypothetical protein
MYSISFSRLQSQCRKVLFWHSAHNRHNANSPLFQNWVLLLSNDPPYFFKGCGKFGTGEGSRKGVVADGHHLLCVLHTDLRREWSGQPTVTPE